MSPEDRLKELLADVKSMRAEQAAQVQIFTARLDKAIAKVELQETRLRDNGRRL